MEFTKILLCIAATAISATGYEIAFEEGIDIVFMYFPDENGNAVLAKIQSTLTLPLPLIVPERDIKFRCYTRYRAGNCQVYVGNVTSLQNCNFNPSKQTCLVAHGFLSSERSKAVQSIKDRYLQVKDCNVIIVDWSRISINPLYTVVKEQTKEVGKYTAIFIDFLVTKFSVNLDTLHLVGHSLGAHVMGIAGKNIKSGKCGRITGLDPAGPCYKLAEVDNRLAKGDAKCVQAIHTCGKLLGIGESIGDINFYPNGGMSPQPGCVVDIFGICSHDCSWKYFAESIGYNNFKATPCGSYLEFLSGHCDKLSKIPMGEPIPCNVKGDFYLQTSPEPPYARG